MKGLILYATLCFSGVISSFPPLNGGKRKGRMHLYRLTLGAAVRDQYGTSAKSKEDKPARAKSERNLRGNEGNISSSAEGMKLLGNERLARLCEESSSAFATQICPSVVALDTLIAANEVLFCTSKSEIANIASYFVSILNHVPRIDGEKEEKKHDDSIEERMLAEKRSGDNDDRIHLEDLDIEFPGKIGRFIQVMERTVDSLFDSTEDTSQVQHLMSTLFTHTVLLFHSLNINRLSARENELGAAVDLLSAMCNSRNLNKSERNLCESVLDKLIRSGDLKRESVMSASARTIELVQAVSVQSLDMNEALHMLDSILE